MTKIFIKSLFLTFTILLFIAGHALANDVRIGVLDIRGPQDAIKSWQQIADHLNTKIPDHHFVIVPYTYKAMDQAVASGQLEFVVANPAQYIEFEFKYGASRIATQVNHVGQSASAYFGTVIFAKANRTDITSLSDLKGKSLITASKTAFASWVVTRDELKRHGISSGDLAELRFAGSSSDNVVTAVKNGEVDVGAVRTNILEQLTREGKIALTDFRILNQKHVEGFTFLLSSELYPEFAFARLKNTSRPLADKVAAQLLLMQDDDPTSRYQNYIEWTVPDNYEKVRKLLQEWKLPPYENYGKITLGEAMRQHWISALLASTALASLLLVVFLSLNIRQRREKYNTLSEAKQKLDLIHAMIVATPDAISIKDKQGRYVFVNPVAALIIGRPAKEIIGKDASDIFPTEDAQIMMQDDSTVMFSATTITYEKQFTLNEEPKQMLVTKGPMYDNDGKVDGLFVVARDINDIKLLQNEVGDKVMQLETALATVRQLEGIIPICSYCKKIRDDEKSWHQLENYISSHSEARFSHGVCPECYEVKMKEIENL